MQPTSERPAQTGEFCAVEVLSPEKEMITRMGALASSLIEKKHFQQLIETLKTLRRCYAVAYRNLQDLIEYEQVDPQVEDFLVQFAMYEAQKPFNEKVVLEGLHGPVLTWLEDIIAGHMRREADPAKPVPANIDERRRNMLIPLPFRHSSDDQSMWLDRERALVLIGWGPAVRWLLRQTRTLALRHPASLSVVELTTATDVKSDGPNRLLNRIGFYHWVNRVNMRADAERLFEARIAQHVIRLLDLVLCEDLSAACTLGYAGRNSGARAGDAHKFLSRGCKAHNCAFFAVIPQKEMAKPDISTPEFEQLRTFAYLRPVDVKEYDQKYYVINIANGATEVMVEKALLHPFNNDPKLAALRF